MTITNKDFKFFTKEDVMSHPTELYFNNLQNFSKPIGIRKERYRNARDVYDIIPDIAEKLASSDDMSIHYTVTLKELIALCNEGDICFNISARKRKDRVQRAQVIAPSLASKLVIGVINGDDVMPEISVIISKEGDTVYILDGLQRTSSIYNFFKKDGSKITRTNTILDGCCWTDFDNDVRREIMNRTISLKVTCGAMMPYRADIFRVLNTTQTKMSTGEDLNTKYWSTHTMEAATELVHTAPFSTMLGNEDAKGNVRDDRRFAATASLLNVLSVKELYNGNIAPSKCKSLPTFAEQYILQNAGKSNEAVDEAFQDANYIMRIIKNNFPCDICHVMNANIKVSSKAGYPAHYSPYARKSRVSIAYLSALYCAVDSLCDVLPRLPSNVKEEIASAVDTLFGDSTFISETMRNNTGKNAIKRVDMTIGAITEVLDKHGITH